MFPHYCLTASCELGLVPCPFTDIRMLAYRKVNYLPKVLQLNNGGPRMQTPAQNCPYNLHSPGESARKALGPGHQGEAAIQIWLHWPHRSHVCPRAFSLHGPLQVSTQATRMFLLTTWAAPLGQGGGVPRAGREQKLVDVTEVLDGRALHSSLINNPGTRIVF